MNSRRVGETGAIAADAGACARRALPPRGVGSPGCSVPRGKRRHTPDVDAHHPTPRQRGDRTMDRHRPIGQSSRMTPATGAAAARSKTVSRCASIRTRPPGHDRGAAPQPQVGNGRDVTPNLGEGVCLDYRIDQLTLPGAARRQDRSQAGPGVNSSGTPGFLCGLSAPPWKLGRTVPVKLRVTSCSATAEPNVTPTHPTLDDAGARRPRSVQPHCGSPKRARARAITTIRVEESSDRRCRPTDARPEPGAAPR
jgi:hypothetical protein